MKANPIHRSGGHEKMRASFLHNVVLNLLTNQPKHKQSKVKSLFEIFIFIKSVLKKPNFALN
ncbi:hypothetical protein DUY71_05340 [Campylobacter coli]|nr:hypothetical protein [Campylobacter coli]EAL7466121.1 hypothetical protein [Campylobacter coli]